MTRPEPLMTVSEVARRLACSPSTVRSLIRRGELSAIRLDREWRIEPEALEQFMARHRTPGEPPRLS